MKQPIKWMSRLSVAALVLPALSLGAQEAEKPEFKMNHYGFIKSDYTTADEAVLSFGNETLLATTMAKRKTDADDKTRRSAFSMNQSRIGFAPSYGDTKGVFEFDFMGAFDKSTSTTVPDVRIRQVGVRHKLGSLELFGGLLPDIYAPLAPSNYNPANAMFQGGNTGFFRQSIGASYKLNDMMSVAVSASNPGNNATPSPSLSVELNGTPAYSAQLKISPAKGMDFFVSGIFANIQHRNDKINPALPNNAGKPHVADPWADEAAVNDYNNGTAVSACGTATVPAACTLDQTVDRLSDTYLAQKTRRQSSAVSLSGSMKLADNMQLAFEMYAGQNLGNLQIHSLPGSGLSSRTWSTKAAEMGMNKLVITDAAAKAGYSALTSRLVNPEYKNIYEQGGWLTFKMGLGSKLDLGLMAGVAGILNPSDMGTQSSVATSGLYTQGAYTNAGHVKENQTLGWNLGYKLADKLTLFVEHQNYKTVYQDSKANMWRHVTAMGNVGDTFMVASIWDDNATTASKLLRIPYANPASAIATANVMRFGMNYGF